MEKECCSVNVVELENGYKIEVTGEDVKEKCKDAVDFYVKELKSGSKCCVPTSCC